MLGLSAVALVGCRPAVSCPASTVQPSATPQARPDTAAPADVAITILESRYDPATDERNEGTGWAFADLRAPTDPRDRDRAAFDIEALYALRSVGDPRWSPDGQRVLFTVTRYDLAAGEQHRDIYLADGDGGGLRRMTRHEGSDGSPQWLPDGSAFVFVSDRGDGSQLWKMPVDGGEPEQLTAISTGVAAPIVSPDGARVAFESSVFPEYGADDERSAERIAGIEASPVQAHIADDLLYRHWTGYQDQRRTHVLVLELASGTIVDVTPGDWESPAFGGSFAFSPDGRELCVESNRDPANAQAWTTNKDLFVVPSTGGATVNLTDANEAHDGHPVYSPDGRYLAFKRQAQPGYESDRFRLAIYERDSGEVTVLTEDFDNTVTDFRWLPGSEGLVFKADVKGRTPLFRVTLDGAITKLPLPGVRAFDVAGDGRVGFTQSMIGRPIELYTVDAAGEQARRLTGFNDGIAEAYDIRPVEELWIDSADGRRIHTFVVKPHGFDPERRYPLIVNVHGGPQSQWVDSFRGDWQVYPGAGYVVAFPNPTGSTGYGQDFTAAISEDWGGRVYEDVMAVTEHMVAQPYVDPKRVGAMGWSYGGYMMNWLLGHTDRFAAIASMMGIYELDSFYGATEELWFPEWDLGGAPWDPDAAEGYAAFSPHNYADAFSTPTLIITGELDYRVPYTQSLQLFTALRRRDVPARLIVFPNDGHWPSYIRSMPLYYAAHLDWFHRYLGGDPSPYDPEAMIRGGAFE